MADRKLDTLPAADVLTSTDGGCLLQLVGRARRRRVGPRFRHLASLLWQGVGA
jgi:L-lactate dehydrogenase complex protein LldE